MAFSTNKAPSLTYFTRYFVFALIIAFLFAGFNTRAEYFLLLNPVHTTALDNFFIYYTLLGDGLFTLLVFVSLLAVGQLLLSFQLVITFLLSGIVCHVFKLLLPAPRPMAFFEPGAYAGFIEGITHAGSNSFPSGHTTSAFAMAALLAFHCSNRMLIIVYLFLATGVAYSRIYLGQHFVEDVIAGAILGVATAILVYRRLKVIQFQWRVQGKPVLIRLT